MKKLVIPLLMAAVLLVPSGNTQAQFVVNDPIHMGVHIGEFAKHIQQWMETLNNFQVIKDAKAIAGVTKDITGQVKDISGQVRDLTSQGLEFQRNIQDKLKLVQGIKDLSFSNPRGLYAYGMKWSGNDNFWMPGLDKARRLRNALDGATETDVSTVYEVFNRFDVSGNSSKSAAQYRAAREESAVSQYAYEAMSSKKRVELAFSYQKIADEMTVQSTEMLATLKNDGRYSMTEAERIQCISVCNDNMVKAMKLREEADKMLLAASQSAGEATRATEIAYQDQISQAAFVKMDEARPTE